MLLTGPIGGILFKDYFSQWSLPRSFARVSSKFRENQHVLRITRNLHAQHVRREQRQILHAQIRFVDPVSSRKKTFLEPRVLLTKNNTSVLTLPHSNKFSMGRFPLYHICRATPRSIPFCSANLATLEPKPFQRAR